MAENKNVKIFHCTNYGGCKNADNGTSIEIDEMDALDDEKLVCPECHQHSLEEIKKKPFPTKLVAIISVAVVVIAAVIGAVLAFSGSNEPESLDIMPKELELTVGESKTLEVMQLDEEKYEDLQLKWEAQTDDNTKVVEVSQDGKVTALRAGKATVIVCLADNEEVKAECDVTVEKKIITDTGGEPTGPGPLSPTPQLVALKPTTVTLKVGETTKLEPQTKPADAAVTITWTSENTKVATVGRDGTVTAVKAGTTKITGTLNNTPVTATVTVKEEKTNGGGGGTTSNTSTTSTTTSSSGSKVSFGRYSGPANGLGGTIYVTKSYSLDLNDGSGEALYLEPGDQIQNTKFENNQLRGGVWVHNGSRRSFHR